MKNVTKFICNYQVNFDGHVVTVHNMPQHYYLANMARIFSVSLDRVRVKFLGCISVIVPLFDDDDLPF